MNQYPREQCCFATGHRDMPEHKRAEITARIRRTVEHLIHQGVCHFYAGGAIGFDQWFSLTVLELKKAYPSITLSIFLPNKDYSARWPYEDKICNKRILARADEVCVIPSNGKEPALARNDAMIARGSICVAYLKDNIVTRRGGTAYTVRHAMQAGCRIFTVAKVGDGCI